MELEVSESLLKYIKSYNHDFHSLVDIKNNESTIYISKPHIVDYISVEFYKTSAPRITYKTDYMDLSAALRDIKIESILNFKEPETDFDVESIIYTPAQRDRLARLRKTAKSTAETRVHGYAALKRVQMEYAKSFEVGDKVYYQEGKGVITYKHKEKENSGTQQRWSVKMNDTEYRYISGTSLLKRKEEDLSHVPVDEKLSKLSTEKLLKILRKTRDHGVGDVRIKRKIFCIFVKK